MINYKSTDSEYQPELDEKTRPINVTMASPYLPEAFLIHPNACNRVKEKAREVGDKIFESPFAPIDYLDVEWKDVSRNCKNYQTYEVEIFWSFKDIEFLFASEADYRAILPQLSRTRRISSMHEVHTDKGIFMTASISLPWAVHMPDPNNDGKMRWFRLSIKIIDVSAMQGSESLETYAHNVGIVMDAKETYTPAEKAKMEEMYCADPAKFKRYALGDARVLHEIRVKTVEFYNEIAKLIDIEPRTLENFWGLSTGKIVGSMLHEWIVKQLGIEVDNDAKSDILFKINCEAGSEGFTTTSKKLRDRLLIYLGMVDGGRAVRERFNALLEGVLVDIDILGCYGNGLKNQTYACGIPTITNQRTSLRQWLKKYGADLVPGLWYARISWNNAPFKQDLLISKTSEKFESWNWVVNGGDSDGFECDDDGKKTYDAGMVLTTNSVHQAALNHDLLQVIQNYSSNAELNWLYDNAIIESSAMYLKSHEVSEVTDRMIEGIQLSDDINTLATGSKQWVRVELSPLMDLLLTERKKHPKKTPINTFLKLIINTIYGVIASEFFSVPGACVSNVIVGNNITSRARVLAWCMAKGFHSIMSITDGGVYCVNQVLKFKSTSLAAFEQLHQNKFTNPTQRKVAFKVPLFNREIDYEEAKLLQKSGELDKQSWLHLSSIFAKLDIFIENQFSFETKGVYNKLTLHSKVDYRLEQINGETTYAFRGMRKVWDESKGKKVFDPKAEIMFDAVEKNDPKILNVVGEELLSLADWETHPRKNELLPHDVVSKNQIFYSHTPNDLRYRDLTQYKKVRSEYQSVKSQAKQIIPLIVAMIKEAFQLSRLTPLLLRELIPLFDVATRITAMCISEIGRGETT